MNEGTLVTLDGSGSRNPDGEPLTTYQWTQVAGPDVLKDLGRFSQSHLYRPHGAPRRRHPYLRAHGRRRLLDRAPDSVNITVKDVNHAPEADAGPDQRVNEGALGVMLNSRASTNPDNDILTYRWAQTAGPPVTLSDSTSPTPSFTAPLVGPVAQTLTFKLTVDDGLAFADDTVDVVVENVNHPPTANTGADQTVNEGNVVTLNGTASSDPDSNPLSYSWSPTSGTGFTLSGATTAAPTFTAPPQPAAPRKEALTFQLLVDDGLGGTASDSVSVTVQSVDVSPPVGLAQAKPAVLTPPDHKWSRWRSWSSPIPITTGSRSP